jgi:hypothetical protein
VRLLATDGRSGSPGSARVFSGRPLAADDVEIVDLPHAQ